MNQQQVDTASIVDKQKEFLMIEVTLEYLSEGEWKESVVKLDIEADMALTDEGLDEQMCALPRKIAQYAEVAAELHAMSARRKSRVEAVEAEVALATRLHAVECEVKVTEPRIKEAVATSPLTTAARNAYYAADAEYRKVDGFYRALREKASLSIALCYKQKAEIQAMSGPLN